jgi:hypothetical protein
MSTAGKFTGVLGVAIFLIGLAWFRYFAFSPAEWGFSIGTMILGGILSVVGIRLANAGRSSQSLDGDPSTKGDWVTVGEYSNAPSAQVASALLTTMGLKHRIWPTTRLFGTAADGDHYIWVAPELVDEATRILSTSTVSERELATLALKDPPPDDA